MLGLRIFPMPRRAEPEWVQRFAALPVANVGDVMSRMSAGGARLRPMHAGGVLAGPAFTVRTRPGDNLLVHKALAMAQPGDIIVVDAGGDLTNAIIGELMSATAEQRGLGGFVINGAIRDAGTLAQGALPVYAAGVTHRGPYKDGPGEINVPVSLDGMVIHPGDLVIGDEDGLLAVPYDEMAAVYALAKAKQDAEAVTMQEIREGRLDTAWIDATLNKLGCEYPTL